MLEDISIVIPTFNEGRRIAGTLSAISAHLRDRRWSGEVIVSDDGSRDDTCVVVERFMGDGLPVRIVRSPRNLGKGSAVRQGVLISSGHLVLVSDADLATPIEEADRLHERLCAGADIAIASRGLRNSQIRIHQPLLRELLGRAFNLLVQLSVFPGLWDTQCGFKLFRGAVARRLFALSRINGFAFDVEILGLARRLGYTVAEVPVRWKHVEESKVRTGRDGVKMLGDLARIIYGLHTGRYAVGDGVVTVDVPGERVVGEIPGPGSVGSGRV